MDLWFRSLSRKDKAKLKIEGSTWGRDGGRIIASKARRTTKTFRKNEKLRCEREARYRAEHAAYEARCALPPLIKGRHGS
jgi:hypothetical protein